MNNENINNQGEILKTLVRKRAFSVNEFAKQMNLHPSSLSRIFQSKKLTAKVREQAAKLLEVDESVFDLNQEDVVFYKIASKVDATHEPSSGYDSLPSLIRLLEEKDKRHYEERTRLLGIIETLTNKIK